MKRTVRAKIAFTAASVICCPRLLQAQIDRASITGVVHNSTGAVIQAVGVTAVNSDTQPCYTGSSNESGTRL